MGQEDYGNIWVNATDTYIFKTYFRSSIQFNFGAKTFGKSPCVKCGTRIQVPKQLIHSTEIQISKNISE